MMGSHLECLQLQDLAGTIVQQILSQLSAASEYISTSTTMVKSTHGPFFGKMFLINVAT